MVLLLLLLLLVTAEMMLFCLLTDLYLVFTLDP